MKATADLVTVDRTTGEIVEDGKSRPGRPDRANKDFIMVYRRFIQQVADLGLEDAQALRVLLFLCRHMDYKNALAVPMGLMAEMLHVSRQTVSAKVQYLSENGWIAIYKLGRQNVYIVNPDVVWTAWADSKEYATFDAKIMLSREDNWNVPTASKQGVRHIDRTVLRTMARQEFPDSAESGNE